jgi:hypothetical protein
MTSNTDKELYEWAWKEYRKGNEIDILLNELKRRQKAIELYLTGDMRVMPGHDPCHVTFNNGHIPLLIEALENLR